MTTLAHTTRLLPTILTQEEVMAYAVELAHTVQETGAETESQKTLKDSMKAKLSQLQARQTILSIMVATGKEYRAVEVDIRLVGGDTIHEVRTDTGEVVVTRPPTPGERQAELGIKGGNQ